MEKCFEHRDRTKVKLVFHEYLSKNKIRTLYKRTSAFGRTKQKHCRENIFTGSEREIKTLSFVY